MNKPDEWNNPSPLPQPCTEKTWGKEDFQATYTVPKKPPPIIEICSFAEDYVEGNEGYHCDDFATGEWSGSLTEFERGYRHNSTAKVLFSFNEERDGTIKGAGRFKLISDSAPWNNCTLTRKLITPDPLLFPISGKRVGEEFYLELPTDMRLKLRVNADCPPPQTSGTGTETRSPSLGQSGFFFRPKVKAQDGATRSFHDPGAAIDVSGTIEIHRAKP